MTSTGTPAMCHGCGLKPRAFTKGIYCLDCLPGGPHVPPPCRRLCRFSSFAGGRLITLEI